MSAGEQPGPSGGDERGPIASRLEALRDSGAYTFDPPAFELIETLLAKAHGVDHGARAILLARARARCDELDHALSAARERAQSALAPFDDLRRSCAPALQAGALTAVIRAARREARSPRRKAPEETERVARLRALATERGVRWRDSTTPPATMAAADDARLLATALYETSRARAEAIMTAHSAEADLPKDAGPYNPLALSVSALAELSRLSPAYLAALVGNLSELGAILALPAPPSATPRTSPPPRRPRKPRP